MSLQNISVSNTSEVQRINKLFNMQMKVAEKYSMVKVKKVMIKRL